VLNIVLFYTNSFIIHTTIKHATKQSTVYISNKQRSDLSYSNIVA